MPDDIIPALILTSLFLVIVATIMLIGDLIIVSITNKRLSKFNEWYERNIEEDE